MNSNLKKTYLLNTIGSGLYSFSSLFFLMIATRVNGINEAGIFTICFSIACMFYTLGTYCGRTYQVSENNLNISNNDYIKHRYITFILMIIISFIFGVINNYDTYKMGIYILLIIVKGIEAISDVYHGIMQKNNRLDQVGLSLFIRSFLNIIVFLLTDIITKKIMVACLSMVIVNILMLLFYDIKSVVKEKDKTVYANIITIFKLGFYTFAISFITNYLANAPKYAIDKYLNNDFQTIFGIIVMPASIIMLISQFVIQPLIITLKEYSKEYNKKKFIKLTLQIIITLIITGIVSIVLANYFGAFALNILYGIKLSEYINLLLIILVGATLYSVVSILSNILIILRKTKGQLYIYLTVSVLAYFICNLLVKLYSINGAVLSYLIIMILLLLMYIIYFIISINKYFRRKDK